MKSKTQINDKTLESFKIIVKNVNKFLNDLMEDQKNKNENFTRKTLIIKKDLKDGGRKTKGVIV